MGDVGPGWDQLNTVQQWMCEQVLGVTPATEDEKPPPAAHEGRQVGLHYAAAAEFYAREGHIRCPASASRRSPPARVRRSRTWAVGVRLTVLNPVR
ncbi:hypothetical protein [Streptomyces sp. NPDC091259]|uniref:hypothetical protein n=1 Tax=Streptomyces sp. NPDC091259 TaxID=3365976 RepID=UPI003802CEEC